jgi:uncharacterized phage protein (TIGR02220 family)
MPNRIIRESCRTSPTLATLSHGAERLFWRLTTVADDFGRFEADPMVMMAQCFPNMLHSVKIKDVEGWIAEVIKCELMRTYVSNGKTLGFFVTWEKHQIKRARASKYPEPDAANICSHLRANVSEKREARSESSDVPRSETAPLLSGSGPTDDRVVLAWLNTKAQRTYRPTPVNLDFIRARLKDGIAVWQLKAIVSRKVREWTGTEQAKYLRPATLFNRTKCEQYLGELPPEEVGNGNGMP